MGIFALYVLFYPQLAAGPIERVSHLLPQFREKHIFNYERVTDGLKLMAWGFFQKMVIADHLAVYVDNIYSHPQAASGVQLFLATFFFSIQIYCDFCGYTDIARGAAQVMGFQLIQNFRQPYLSQSVTEFWQRWHISLSSWFRDYVYIPLGGNRKGFLCQIFNIVITFLLSGLWHGANWTFVVWGFLHGTYVVLFLMTESRFKKISYWIGLNKFPLLQKSINVFITFNLVLIAGIFFRSSSLQEAFYISSHMFRGWQLEIFIKEWNSFSINDRFCLGAIGCLFVVHLLQNSGMNIRKTLTLNLPIIRWGFYYGIILSIWLFGFSETKQFIYFQF